MTYIKLKSRYLILVLMLALGLVSCVSTLSPLPGVPEVSISEYERLVKQKTKKIEVYDGLYNKLTVQATWLDSDLTLASLSHNARLLQWDEEKYKQEKSTVISHHASTTEFFISFYTPEQKQDNLSSNKSIWKIYLDVDGRRFEGKASKVKLQLTEVQALYPHHNRWSTPYMLSFPIATGLSDNKKATLTLTGPAGVAQLSFND